VNPQYKRKGKTRAEILKENPNAFSKLTKKELSDYAIKEINKRLEIIENKIKSWEDSFFWKNLSSLNVKGFWSKSK
jgi:hypothetical protein